MCNVKLVAHSDKPTENNKPTLQFHSAQQDFRASFSSLFWFNGPQLDCFGSVSCLSPALFPATVMSFFQTKHSDTSPAPNSRQIRLVAKEPDIFPGDGGDQSRPKMRDRNTTPNEH